MKRTQNSPYHCQSIIAAVMDCGVSVMIWGCFGASGSGRLGVTKGPTNYQLYQEQNVRASVCDQKLKRSWVIQHDNDPKHRSKFTTERFKQKKFSTSQWPNQSPDPTSYEMLCCDVKQAIQERHLKNVHELKQCTCVISRKHWLMLLAVNKIPQKFCQ